MSRSLILSFLALLSTGCAVQAPIRQIDPPPADLAIRCEAGPDYPTTGARLADVLDIVGKREAAAADCRARHRALVAAWPK
jgi:hypothetical protein